MKYIKLFFLNAILLMASVANGQDMTSFQRGYNNGKDLYNLGKYDLAMEAFKPLTKQEAGNPFAIYASFYYALSAFKAGQENTAKNMLLQINQRYPTWEKSDDVFYWLSTIYFDQEDYDKGMKASAKIQSKAAKKDVEAMKIHFLNEVNDLEFLKSLLQQNPYDIAVAQVLASKLAERPLDGENAQLLDFLVNEFNLDPAQYTASTLKESKKKESYNVAVFFPFMMEELAQERNVRSNQFVLDTYEGIKLAVEKLNSEGKKIALYAYDTKKDSVTTAAILQRPEISQMDLIIGPLYPASSKLVSAYTYSHKINMLNPLSSNSEVIGGNPMSFLFKPSLETQAKAAAIYASETFKENPSTMIVYGETARDSILAFTYKKVVEEHGLEVDYIKKSDQAKAEQLLKFLTEKEGGEEEEEEDENAPFLINPGHIFITITDELVVASAISALEIRGDRLPVITLEDWLQLGFVSYEQLDRLQIRFIAPNYINYEKEEVVEFKEAYVKETHTLPSQYAYTGYDMMLFFGNTLHKYGNYFQQGFTKSQFEKGSIFTGHQYKNKNDNQFVPIVQFKGPVLEVVNSRTQEAGE